MINTLDMWKLVKYDKHKRFNLLFILFYTFNSSIIDYKHINKLLNGGIIMNFKVLIAMFNVYADNFRVIHWGAKGKQFDRIHSI